MTDQATRPLSLWDLNNIKQLMLNIEPVAEGEYICIMHPYLAWQLSGRPLPKGMGGRHIRREHRARMKRRARWRMRQK